MVIALSGFAWTLLVVLYLVCLVTIGITCIRKGHWIMFIVGIVLPIFWIIGAVMPPTVQGRAV